MFLACLSLLVPFGASAEKADKISSDKAFDLDAIVKEASEFFGVTSEELAKVVAKAFKEHGRPNAFIKGTEAAGALGIGLRAGNGTLKTIDGKKRNVHWEGPSIGLDIGVNASKVLMLVYRLDSVDSLYQRFKGVEGSIYIVAGVGVNYLVADDIVIAPIRAGVGWRQGANIGFVRFSEKEGDDPI